MPIQNVGTLLENLVVTEATLALLPLCNEQAPFEFLNSFAMPPCTPWVPHSQNDRNPAQHCLSRGATLQSRIPCRMWLNDIRNGHYGDAIPELNGSTRLRERSMVHRRVKIPVFLFVFRTLHIQALLGISPEYCRNGLRPPVHVSAF